MTPHIHAQAGDFAPTVLMPGDPLRAKYIAETFLQNAREVSRVRNALAFTGEYNGIPVSVMGSGMGMPSIGIYSWELYNEFAVENIIRIGSCGAYTPELKLYDVLLAEQAWSESSFARVQSRDESPIKKPHPLLNEAIRNSAAVQNFSLHEGTIHSSDVFYRQNFNEYQDIFRQHNALAVEMESFALFHNAQVLNKRAACLLTVSDQLITGEAASAEDRETAFTNMMAIALGALPAVTNGER